MWTRQELKSKAQISLKKNYWPAVLTGLVLALCTAGGSGGSGGSRGSNASNISDGIGNIGSHAGGIENYIMPLLAAGLVIILIAGLIGLALSIFLLNPLSVGCQRYFVLSSMQDAKINEMGFGLKSQNYKNVVKIMFLRWLYIFLWTLLFIIPGIVKAYEYRMVPFLLAENPNLSKEEAFRLSKDMMYGEKMNAFVLDLSFLGWIVLSIFTCGILSIFYVNPYVYYTNAELYLALRPKVISNPDEDSSAYYGAQTF